MRMRLVCFGMVTTSKIKSNSRYRADEIFYQIGKGFWLPFCLIGNWFAHGGYERYGKLTACDVRRICGFPCPGCGGTRAFYYLFLGEFARSFYLNPTVIYGVLAYFHFMILYFYRKHISGTIQKKEIHIQYYMYVAIAVILTQWVVKLLYFLHII